MTATAVAKPEPYILPVYTYAHKTPKRSEEVTEFGTEDLLFFEKCLWKTMYSANGLGLAAMQVGRFIRMAVIHVRDSPEKMDGEKYTMVNPIILESSGEQVGPEGCLSLPGFRHDRVARPAELYVQFLDAHGKEQRIVAQGLAARAIAHEIGHFDGEYFFEHIKGPGMSRLLAEYRRKRERVLKGKSTCQSVVPLVW